MVNFMVEKVNEKKIKVLMLVTFFAPDSSISAVRPSMFARYLSKAGCDVTVIRSGRINGKADNSLWKHVKDLRIISYDGYDSVAEKYSRGEVVENPSPLQGTRHFRFINNHNLRMLLRTLYDPFQYLRCALTEKKKIRAVIDKELNGETFDVVYATYGDVGNVLISHYAARTFKSKLIIDLRDAMCVQLQSGLLRSITSFLQRKYLRKADVVTCVTQGLVDDMRNIVGNKATLLYNGYVPQESVIDRKEDSIVLQNQDILTLFYGGDMYGGKRDFSALFSAIRELALDNEIDLAHIRFVYAGAAFEVVEKQAKKYELQEILENHGYVSRGESDRLQKSSDIFLVATWNTTKEQGIMTGKFYESMRNHMPIIAVVTGNKSDSEMGRIISRFDLGVCYEQADHTYTYCLLKQYIKRQYTNKIRNGRVEYLPKGNVEQQFSYEYLSQQLEDIIKDVIS